jgi:Tfp pilus assembly protein PilE
MPELSRKGGERMRGLIIAVVVLVVLAVVAYLLFSRLRRR